MLVVALTSDEGRSYSGKKKKKSKTNLKLSFRDEPRMEEIRRNESGGRDGAI